MATEIAKAYVQLIPSTEGFKNKVKNELGDFSDEGKDAGGSFGSGLVGKLKGVLAAAGLGAIVKQTLDAGGALQQSFGGLDTLYGEASQAAKDYAREAAAAGISMNDYAEQAVSFGASLKSAFKGDVAQAAEAANTAILDMADNAAKMGTPLESIQNAYQGFAKGQYNMLDNLKLGYGGTKTEMEKLLKDAEKLSGVHYDLDNLGDVYSAIHVIQEDLGLTGVAAAEASETFTGSFEAMKASATNLMADLATGNGDAIYDDIQTLFKGVETFVFKNLAPMVKNIISRFPQLLSNLMFEVGDLLKQASTSLDFSGGFVTEFLDDLVGGFFQNIPVLIDGLISFIVAAIEGLLTFDWLGLLSSLAETMVSYLDEGFYEIGAVDTSFLDMMLDWINNTIPHLAKEAITLVLSLVNGIIDGLPKVVETAAPLIASFVAGIAQNLPQIIKTGFDLLTKLIVGIINAIPKLIAALPKIYESIKKAFSEYDWATLGSNILEGIKNGIVNAISKVVEAAKNAATSIYNTIKDFFEIGSPSKLMEDEIGHWIPAGVAVGIEANADSVNKAMTDLANGSINALDLNKDRLAYSTTLATSNDSGLSELARAIQTSPTNVVIRLEGDADRLFKVMQSESISYNKRTGQPAFA